MSDQIDLEWNLESDFESSLGCIQKMFLENKKRVEQTLSLKKRGFDKFEGIEVSDSPMDGNSVKHVERSQKARNEQRNRENQDSECAESGNMLRQIRFDDFFGENEEMEINPERWRPVNSKFLNPVGRPKKSKF